MPFTTAGQLARFTPTARPDDDLGLVAENLRESHYGSIPVLDGIVILDEAMGVAMAHNGRVQGLIDERDLSRAILPTLEPRLAESQAARVGVENSPFAGDMAQNAPGALLNGHAGLHDEPNDFSAGPVSVLALTARDVMRRDIGIVPAAFSLHNALLTLDRYDSAALPVVDGSGRYMGMISRADVVAALGRQVRPPVVGGMATPLGVWLTTGNLSAGAPPLGLFLSGLTMGFCFVVAHMAMFWGLYFLNSEWAALFMSGRLGADADNGSAFNFAVTTLQSLLFLLVLRALPMAGIHAAEHQTVWAIERGVPLTPEYVAQMPRAHPRCGTNLVALSGLILAIFQHLPSFNPANVVLSLLFVYLTWRNFGGVLQEWFTTKPATRKQLESGIRAGKGLLEKYQDQPHVNVSFGVRLFNSGLALSALGMMLAFMAYGYLQEFVARAIWGLG